MMRREFITLLGGVAARSARATTGKIAPDWGAGVCVASASIR
jgi:hypothetical protein